MNGFPTVKEIKKDYQKCMSLLENIKSLDELKKISEHHFGDVYFGMKGYETVFLNDINHIDMKKVDYLRFDNYGCLDFITFHFNKGDVSYIDFDLWSDKLEGEFVEEVQIHEVTEENLKKWIEETNPEHTYYFYGLKNHHGQYLFEKQEVVMEALDDEEELIIVDNSEVMFCAGNMFYSSDEGDVLSGYDGPFVFYSNPAEDEAKELLFNYLKALKERTEEQLEVVRDFSQKASPFISM